MLCLSASNGDDDQVEWFRGGFIDGPLNAPFVGAVAQVERVCIAVGSH